MMAFRKLVTTTLICLLCWSLLSTAADACPTCKQALSEHGDPEGLVRGYFWSILFMMSMPFLILTGLGTYFYVQVLNARASVAATTVARSSGSTDVLRAEQPTSVC